MKRRKRLFVVLSILALGALASLPWQLKQWQSLEAERKKTALQETQLRELTQTRQQTDSARTQMPTDPPGRLQAAMVLVKSGDTKHALPILRILENDSHRIPGMASTLGDLYRQVGQVDRAYALLSGALSTAPNDPATLVRMGYLELSLGERETAQARFRKAQSVAPTDPEPYLAEAYYEDQEGKFPLAEALLKKALAVAPDRWTVAVLLADNQGKQKHYDEALKALETLQQQHPGEPQILAQQARTLLDAANAQPSRAKAFQQKATDVLDDAIKLSPGDASLYFEQGRAWRDWGDLAKAKQAWEESYRLKANYPKLAGQLGNLLLRQGDQERGRRLLAEEARSEEGRTSFNVEAGKVMQAWKDGRARRRFALWCATNQKTARAILEWERLLRDYPGDTEAVREIERLKKSEIE